MTCAAARLRAASALTVLFAACDAPLVVGSAARDAPTGEAGEAGEALAGRAGEALAGRAGEASLGRGGAASAGRGGGSPGGSGGASGAASGGGSSSTCESPLLASAVAAGEHHACAVTLDGAVYCWGSGASGQLGNDDSADSASPVRVASNETFVSVAALTASTCALSSASELFCWGNNFDGVLADGTELGSVVPVSVLDGVTAFAGAGGHVVAVAGGRVWTWGSNTSGQLGLGSSSVGTTVRRVTEVPGVTAVTVTAGTRFVCLLDADGVVSCAGSNAYRQLGRPGADSPSFAPAESDERFVRLDAGYQRSCALTAAGAARCWGDNEPPIVSGAPDVVAVPTALDALDGYTQVSVGFWHLCLLRGDQVHCAGGNDHGEVGVEPGGPVSGLTPLAEPATYSAISAGRGFTCAIQAADSSVVCFGDNDGGKLGRTGAASARPSAVCLR